MTSYCKYQTVILQVQVNDIYLCLASLESGIYLLG
jgi:hypothetical protein